MKTFNLLKATLLALPALIIIGIASTPSLADSIFNDSKKAKLVRDGRVIGGAPKAPVPRDKAKVSYEDFKKLTIEVEAHRAKRLISLETFHKMSQEPGVIILDTRTPSRYASTHVKGAVNLAFTEFTQSNLAKVITTLDTKILIYCNNNFDGDEVNFAGKTAPRRADPKFAMKSDAKEIGKPLSLALNVPTYINLYGYGYQNVYELDELVSVNDPRIQFESAPLPEEKKWKMVWKDEEQNPSTATPETK